MAAGLPVVASDFPVWRGIVTQAGCGILVDPLDVAAIAAAIEELLRDPQRAEEMGRRGRAAVEARYSWSSEAAKLDALYQRFRTT
jgi:glycosyltransferase involved in cell wall biosynthesis